MNAGLFIDSFSPESGRVSGSVSAGVSADGLRLLSSTQRELHMNISSQYDTVQLYTGGCTRGGGGGIFLFSFIFFVAVLVFRA